MSTHWANIAETGSVLGMRIMVAIRRGLGYWPYWLILHFVILWYYLSSPQARSASHEFLCRAMPDLQHRRVKRHWYSYRQFVNFGDSIMDRLLAWHGNIGKNDITGPGIEQMQDAIHGGHGGIILVAHHGNNAVINAVSSDLPGKAEVLSLHHTRNAGKMRSVISQFAKRTLPDFIEVSEITPVDAQRMSGCIARGGFVVIAADRLAVAGGRYQYADFLGSAAPFSEGPHQLAALLKCPIYNLACIKQGRRFRFSFDYLNDSSTVKRSTRQRWIENSIQHYAAYLEQRVRQAPLQWYNFFPFWQQPAASPGETPCPR